MIGEYGLAWSNTGADLFHRQVLEMADRNLYGWAYWSYDPSGADGWGLWDGSTGADTPAAALLVRPYVQRWPGDPVEMSWNPDAGVLRAVLSRDPAVDAPLQVYVPDGWSAEAPVAMLDGTPVDGDWLPDDRLLRVALPPTAGVMTLELAAR